MPTDNSAEPYRPPLEDIISVVQQIDNAKPTRYATVEDAVNCKRTCTQSVWTRLDLARQTFCQIQTNNLLTSTATDIIWGVEMINCKNIVGHLRAVMAIHSRQAAERLT